MSEVGFEPTPTFVDQNTQLTHYWARVVSLESGALDHSAILTDMNVTVKIYSVFDKAYVKKWMYNTMDSIYHYQIDSVRGAHVSERIKNIRLILLSQAWP